MLAQGITHHLQESVGFQLVKGSNEQAVNI